MDAVGEALLDKLRPSVLVDLGSRDAALLGVKYPVRLGEALRERARRSSSRGERLRGES